VSELRSHSLGEVGQLTSGIAADLARLGAQTGELLKLELGAQISRAFRMGLIVLPVVCVAVVGLMLLATAAAHLISENSGLTLAGSFALVGAIVLGIGALGALELGRRARGLRLLPSEAIEQLKEDFTWMTKERKRL
jgi:hypothetical protein